MDNPIFIALIFILVFISIPFLLLICAAGFFWFMANVILKDRNEDKNKVIDRYREQFMRDCSLQSSRKVKNI